MVPSGGRPRGCPKKLVSPQLVQWASRSPARVRSCSAAATSKSVRRREVWNGIVVSQTLSSLDDASTTALACSGVSEPSSASLFPVKISWQRWCWVVSWVLCGRVSGVRMGARVASAAPYAAAQAWGEEPGVPRSTRSSLQRLKSRSGKQMPPPTQEELYSPLCPSKPPIGGLIQPVGPPRELERRPLDLVAF
jgi:hypothetical protein